MALVTVRRPAGAERVNGSFPERFGPRAFQRCIGQEVPVKFQGSEVVGTGRLIRAEVVEDGRFVDLTFDLVIRPDGAAG